MRAVILALLAAGATLTLPACSEKPVASETEKEESRPVRVVPVVRSDLDHTLVYVADLKPYLDVKLYSPVPDRIISFPWKDGDEIKRGEVVAQVRRETFNKGLEQIGAQIEALDAQVANLEDELERSKTLLDAGVITRQVFDQLETSYRSALAQRKALEAGKGQLAVSAGNALITAPIDGIIAGKMLEEGDMAAPQIPLCRIMNIERLKVPLKLMERDVSRVRLGQSVHIYPDAYPGKVFEGKLTRIYPYLDPGTRTNTVEVILENKRDEETGQYILKPGMYGKAELVVDVRKQVVVAPEAALLLDTQLLKRQRPGHVLRRAFVVDETQIARQREVELGARKGSRYEVRSGLSEGERLIIRGQHGLMDGQSVRIVEAP